MEPNYLVLDLGLQYVTVTATALVGIYTWWTNRGKATEAAINTVQEASDRQIEQLAGDLHQANQRIVNCEHEVRERLKTSDLSQLYDRLSDLNREMGELKSELQANRHQVGLLQEYLMNGNAIRL
ncbi:MAG: hypothetical protein HYX63_13460 [Gammaproteobacteria bacterium]|nr:hypothetical protein [Gammaproteobacteria bacterium]